MSANGVDPWQKAAECEFALRAATDEQQQQMLTYVRGLWIALANESAFLTADELAEEIEVLNQIYADMHKDMNGRVPKLAS